VSSKLVGFRGALTLFGAVAACAAAARPASATLIASERFLTSTAGDANTYNDSAAVNGQGPTANTSFGFTGTWTSSTLYNVGSATSGLSGFASYSTPANTGGALVLSGINADPRNGTRALSTGVPAGATPSTLWVSALLRFTAGTDDGLNKASVGLISSQPANVTSFLGSGVVGFGVSDNNAAIFPDVNAATPLPLLNGSGNPVSINDNATHFFVLKVEHNVSGIDDRVTAWLDPANGSSEATLDSTSIAKRVSGLSDFYTDAEGLIRYGYDTDGLANSGSVTTHDELRIGTTLADVAVAVPEPTGLALIAATALGTLRRRARRA
jgi:hypothetical protein